ncbi:pyridoxal-dependent decarboxylase [Candidatus Bathycorpusculum sp.]|uniref:pyridoxal phosphate-dependent decarboxylase family protein n=1 Tax=Candidatus Bathycorpusculum sp. TaxID=2994959 RepID=UPI00281D2AC9|nr:pyridoxal-dependent decarboxylase [Candidatus Termitimicrobium sp.]MCL2686215.1 pyridoxal-dependent decarboxylase [Candidatus Termitimicrobium sp.]
MSDFCKYEVHKMFSRYFATENKCEVVKIMSQYLGLLANGTLKYVDKDQALLRGEIDLYKQFLDSECLPINSECPEEVLKQLSKYFQRAVQWENAETMLNITPPANLVSIASSAYASLFNPNFAQDEPSGYLLATELVVTKFLAELVGWDVKKAGGVFTFGGKGIGLYAGKIGLVKAVPNVRRLGVGSSQAVIITSDKAHPCHFEISDWLGLGSDGCLSLPTVANGQMDLKILEDTLREKLSQGVRIGCIIINGGTTNEVIVDPIKKIVDIRDKLVCEFQLDYRPHIHVDSVIGWVWLVYNYYDFKKNRLSMSQVEQTKMSAMCDKISELKYADSFGVDFHKTGFCPYISSCIMVNDRADLHALGGKSAYDIDSLKHGEYSPFEWTLELSRGSGGPISAYTAFKLFGVEGFQELIHTMFSNGEYIRSLLNEKNDFEVINNETEGFATLFVILSQPNTVRYSDYIKLDADTPEATSLLVYNQQFFLFLLKKHEAGEIGFKITFSTNYKPQGAKVKTGCLKIYQSSPIATREKIHKVINQLIELKKEFDNSNKTFEAQINQPADFVYRTQKDVDSRKIY